MPSTQRGKCGPEGPQLCGVGQRSQQLSWEMMSLLSPERCVEVGQVKGVGVGWVEEIRGQQGQHVQKSVRWGGHQQGLLGCAEGRAGLPGERPVADYVGWGPGGCICSCGKGSSHE